MPHPYFLFLKSTSKIKIDNFFFLNSYSFLNLFFVLESACSFSIRISSAPKGNVFLKKRVNFISKHKPSSFARFNQIPHPEPVTQMSSLAHRKWKLSEWNLLPGLSVPSPLSCPQIVLKGFCREAQAAFRTIPFLSCLSVFVKCHSAESAPYWSSRTLWRVLLILLNSVTGNA